MTLEDIQPLLVMTKIQTMHKEYRRQNGEQMLLLIKLL